MLNPVMIKKIDSNAVFPTKATSESTGYDLYSVEELTIGPGEVRAVGTGLVLDLSKLATIVDLQIRPRSGLALKHRVTVVNAPGTIDRDYRGEVKVLLINLGTEPFKISTGDRIAQLVFGLHLPAITFFPVEVVEESTDRGAGGFGSTGK